jgi:hypothetical protein
MSETEAMNIDERRKYIHKMWGRYRQVSKKEKGKLLDEIEAVTGMHRKAILRLLNGRLSRKKRGRERGREYGVEVDDAVGVIAPVWIIPVPNGCSRTWCGWRSTWDVMESCE